MPFLHTTDLLELLKTRLESLVTATSEGKVFERVGYFGAKQLGDALKATFASESRVCFIVPAGDGHTNTRDRNFLFSERHSKVVLLIADKALDQTKQAALVGGANTIGILALKDLVIDNLFNHPLTGDDVAFAPDNGDVWIIQAKEGNNLGRECWMQEFTIFAGSARRAIA